MQQHVLEGMILSVARACLPHGCLPLASWFLSICRCNWRPTALQDALVQEALALHWYFHCFLVQELMPRLFSAAYFLIKWLDPRSAARISPGCSHKGCLPLCKACQCRGRGGGREGWSCLTADVTLLSGIQLGMAPIRLPLWGAAASEEHGPPPPKHQGPSNAWCSAYAASSCSPC